MSANIFTFVFLKGKKDCRIIIPALLFFPSHVVLQQVCIQWEVEVYLYSRLLIIHEQMKQWNF
jgi:hypothetical protein